MLPHDAYLMGKMSGSKTMGGSDQVGPHLICLRYLDGGCRSPFLPLHAPKHAAPALGGRPNRRMLASSARKATLSAVAAEGLSAAPSPAVVGPGAPARSEAIARQAAALAVGQMRKSSVNAKRRCRRALPRSSEFASPAPRLLSIGIAIAVRL